MVFANKQGLLTEDIKLVNELEALSATCIGPLSKMPASPRLIMSD
jgi:hypothetical protein